MPAHKGRVHDEICDRLGHDLVEIPWHSAIFQRNRCTRCGRVVFTLRPRLEVE